MKHACTMKISQRFTVWVRSSFPTWVEKPGSTSKGQKVTLCKLGVFLLFLCLQAIHKLAFYPNKQAVLVAHLQAFFSLCTYSYLYPCFCPPLSPMTTGNPSNLEARERRSTILFLLQASTRSTHTCNVHIHMQQNTHTHK